MLQQTQVEQVLPYYGRFLERFPTIRSLAQATLDEVLKVWQGMGYYRRARYLRDAARQMRKEFGGKIPKRYDQLKTLPGFGPYTCGSVLSFAFHQPYPAVDGNVVRVISRLFRIESDVSRTETKGRITDLVRILIPPDRASEFNQSLMELGALVCRPQNPACRRCCWKTFCRAFLELKDPSDLPNKTKKKPRRHFHIAAGVVQRGQAVLIAKRPANVILGSLWEFPGGKRKVRERLERTCTREIQEETGITARIEKPLVSFKHHYTHYSITIHFFYCRYIRGKARACKSTEVKWVKRNELKTFPFPKTHQEAIDQMNSDLS